MNVSIWITRYPFNTCSVGEYCCQRSYLVNPSSKLHLELSRVADFISYDANTMFPFTTKTAFSDNILLKTGKNLLISLHWFYFLRFTKETKRSTSCVMCIWYYGSMGHNVQSVNTIVNMNLNIKELIQLLMYSLPFQRDLRWKQNSCCKQTITIATFEYQLVTQNGG